MGDNMIPLLKFNKMYYQMIVDGVKTQTIRKSNKRFGTGETVKAIFPGTDLEITVIITDAGYKQFKYIDDEDAEREGYSSAQELKEALLEIYPRLDNFDRVYYYRFEVADSDA